MTNYYRAYCMEYGTFVGGAWSAAFLSFVYGFINMNSLLLMSFMIISCSMIALPFYLALRVRNKMRQDGATMSYWQGLLFAFSMFMYACLLHGLVIYGYFELMDHGALLSSLTRLFSDPELVNVYRQAGMTQMHKELMDTLQQMNEFSSWEKTMILFNSDFTWSMILSFLVAVPLAWPHSKSNKT